MAQFILNLPLWQSIRLLGIVSYTLLAVGICFGIVFTFPGWYNKAKITIFKLHTFTTNVGMVLGLLHGVITIIDPYQPFSWSEILIPFAAQYSPFLSGLGTLAAYGMLIILFTSDFRQKLSRKIWHLVHLLSYPVFLMAFIHGYFLGTDSTQAGIRWIYIISIGVVLLLTVIRFLIQSGSNKQYTTQGAK